MKEKDFSAEKAKQKKDMTDEEKQLLDEYAEVKSRYDEARKKSAEWSEKQALKFLDRFKKKVAGLNETQKKEVVRKSIKELSENRVLQYDLVYDAPQILATPPPSPQCLHPQTVQPTHRLWPA